MGRESGSQGRLEVLVRLLRADEQARERVRRVEEEARDIVERARQDASTSLEEARREAWRAADRLVEEAIQEEERSEAPVTEGVDPTRLRRRAEPNRDSAVTALTRWVLGEEP